MALTDLAQQIPLATGGTGAHLWLIAVGAVLVLGLLLAFVLGQRRKDREPPPADLGDAGSGPRRHARPR
ncbi:LPXTG cell wall anchor domain-containing protein [Kitasatospora paranensis]|uniref:LPXTG cell wall anchor domain-containing protein n=1 Tax=Kitasatospora paranensis TaxID=258053 RepID=A0ABW2GBR2_9ACTN